MTCYTRYVQDEQHYAEVLSLVSHVKRTLWIGTADIKDLYIKKDSVVIPFLGLLSSLIESKVEIRLIHAKEPGTNFRNDFDKYPLLASQLERVLCPRVHFKLFIFDMQTAYIGSANLTGAGIGMKGEFTRNFESGILTNEPDLVNAAINQFDAVWMGSFCQKCKRKDFCQDRIG